MLLRTTFTGARYDISKPRSRSRRYMQYFSQLLEGRDHPELLREVHVSSGLPLPLEVPRVFVAGFTARLDVRLT